ncbi:histidine kinase [Serinibacter arcticus]|uniref:Histidine kinase n=1 Tax=Serinibacter arcticus TaxID=1655435 RepID=A0A2U1ZZN9_9MICO|nr:histidine kinase [Serinibacter arcticus]
MPAPAARPRFVRPVRGRWVAGVASGLATHLGVDPRIVRTAFVVATLLGGVGALAYLFWWVTVPPGVPGREPAAPAWSRLARPLTTHGDGGPHRGVKVSDVVVALGLLAVAALLLASRLGERPTQSWVVPTLLLLAGAALTWSELDARRPGSGGANGASGTASNGRVRIIRLAGGIAITAIGVFLLVGQRAEPVVMVQSALAAVAVLAGVALVLAPWWLRLVRELGDARAERERESERADIAAHLHDSVLQTLALIRTRSTEPEVVRLARAQERDLRSWLYDDRVLAATSFAVQVKEVVAEIEDTRTHSDGTAPQIETVVVGDVVPSEETHAVLAATREALLNAIAHGRPPVSVYLEASENEVEVFVRDHGDGFDLDDVSPDRFGVRESILGRVRRRGGQASVREVPDGGTEVRIYLPRSSRGEGEE